MPKQRLRLHLTWAFASLLRLCVDVCLHQTNVGKTHTQNQNQHRREATARPEAVLRPGHSSTQVVVDPVTAGLFSSTLQGVLCLDVFPVVISALHSSSLFFNLCSSGRPGVSYHRAAPLFS